MVVRVVEYDEDNTDPQARNPARNPHVETAVAIQYLRSKIGTIKNSVTSVEEAFGRRIASLEKQVSGFRRKLILVRGFLYGLAVAGGSSVWALFDKLKQLGIDIFDSD